MIFAAISAGTRGSKYSAAEPATSRSAGMSEQATGSRAPSPRAPAGRSPRAASARPGSRRAYRATSSSSGGQRPSRRTSSLTPTATAAPGSVPSSVPWPTIPARGRVGGGNQRERLDQCGEVLVREVRWPRPARAGVRPSRRRSRSSARRTGRHRWRQAHPVRNHVDASASTPSPSTISARRRCETAIIRCARRAASDTSAEVPVRIGQRQQLGHRSVLQVVDRDHPAKARPSRARSWPSRAAARTRARRAATRHQRELPERPLRSAARGDRDDHGAHAVSELGGQPPVRRRG